MNLVQIHKCSFSIMGPHISKIKLCYLNSSIHAAWSETQFEVYRLFMSQKLKKLNEEESQPFGPSCPGDSVVYTPPSSMATLTIKDFFVFLANVIL